MSLEYFLVPKKWIEEIIFGKVTNFCIFLYQLRHPLNEILSNKVKMLGNYKNLENLIRIQSLNYSDNILRKQDSAVQA